MSEPGAAFTSSAAGRSIREWVVRLLLLFAGLTIAHLGITLFILSHLGSDPFTTFAQGLAGAVSVSIGSMFVILFFVLMFAMLFFTKGYVKPGTAVCAFCGGPIIDVFSWLLEGIVNAGASMPVRVAAMLTGTVILAIGMALVIKSDAGTGPNDLVAMILTDTLRRFQFRWMRIACDAIFTAAGFLLGGVVGFGTLAAILLVGPVAQVFFPLYDGIVPVVVRKFVPRA